MRPQIDSWHSAIVEQPGIRCTSSEPLAAGLLRTLSRGYSRLPSPVHVEEKGGGSSNYATCGPPATISTRPALRVIATGGTYG
jgi:hypothetical protein